MSLGRTSTGSASLSPGLITTGSGAAALGSEPTEPPSTPPLDALLPVGSSAADPNSCCRLRRGSSAMLPLDPTPPVVSSSLELISFVASSSSARSGQIHRCRPWIWASSSSPVIFVTDSSSSSSCHPSSPSSTKLVSTVVFLVSGPGSERCSLIPSSFLVGSSLDSSSSVANSLAPRSPSSSSCSTTVDLYSSWRWRGAEKGAGSGTAEAATDPLHHRPSSSSILNSIVIVSLFVITGPSPSSTPIGASYLRWLHCLHRPSPSLVPVGAGLLSGFVVAVGHLHLQALAPFLFLPVGTCSVAIEPPSVCSAPICTRPSSSRD